MNSQAGIWIDHRQAIVVTMTAAGGDLRRIASDVETQPRREGDSPMSGDYEALQVPPDDRHLRAVTGHLNAYYDRVVDSVRDANAVLIFGPGEAKGEFKKRMESAGPKGRMVTVETADKMTEKQIQAKVREHFSRGHGS